ncbi:MAG: type IV toxin-antitoxin system AbiEi family antitoxin, partial [Solirubrobacterales bacterium]
PVGDKGHEEGRHRPLFELASRQHGVVSTRQLARIGYGRNSASKANRVRRLRRIHRGVYAVGHEPLTWHGHCMAAVLAARPALASHASAAWLWGLTGRSPSRIAVTVPSSRRHRREFRLHVAELPTPDRAARDGIPVTAWARTVLDMAATSNDRRVQRMIRRSEELRLFDLRLLDGVLERYGHHPGSGRLRRVLRAHRPDETVTRSELERRFRALVRRAGLPEPAMNHVVHGIEVDAYWEPEAFVVELDSYATHGDPTSFETDRVREATLLRRGIAAIRITDVRLKHEPRRVIAEVSENLALRRQPPASS